MGLNVIKKAVGSDRQNQSNHLKCKEEDGVGQRFCILSYHIHGIVHT